VVTTISKRQAAMKRKKEKRRSTKNQSPSLVRASISFPPDLYETLDEIAKQKKVSLAWVVRDAAEKYVADRTAETTRPRADTPEAAR
jgi:Ribbon-helix-helix protein, copG family